MEIATRPSLALSLSGTRIADLLELTKPRITLLVLVTTAAGYALGLEQAFSAPLFFSLIVGTALVAGGGSALNQYFERGADAQMLRTRGRPLPSGRVTPSLALGFGIAISAAGLLLLAAAVGWLPALLGAASLALYALLYTALKRVTPLCTIVGAVPGAIPPLMGWAAARGTLSGTAWGLFAILFLWQLPHFLAIAWMYREDYARGGFPMLPVTDRDGGSTARQMVLSCAALLPATVIAGAEASAGRGFLFVAVALGLLFLLSAARFAWKRSVLSARWVFWVSVLYLPAVLGLMVFDR